MQLKRNAVFGPALILLVLISLPSLPPMASHAKSLSGQVVIFGTGLPIKDATVRVFSIPPKSEPEFETKSDDFGFFNLPQIAPANYSLVAEHPRFITKEENVEIPVTGTNRVVRLTSIDATTFFDIFFDVRCLATHVSLAGASIRAEYWRPDGSIGGPPDAVFQPITGPFGTVTLVGMVDGFYSFSITRPGWEPISYTPPAGAGLVIDGDRVRLIRGHFASVFMRPIRQNLQITVQGFDPVANEPGKPLKAMLLSLTGIDPTINVVAVPTQSARTGEDGTYIFQNLPPIDWKVVVGRHGYFPKEVLIKPAANGTFAPVTIDVELEPTKINVILASIYETSRAVTNALVRLQGVRHDNTDGIDRVGSTSDDPSSDGAAALFENLLPGRYWIQVIHSTVIDNLYNRSGPLPPMASAFAVSFFPRETYAEVLVGVTEEVKINLEPVPARIRGRLMATDELANVETERFDPEPNRVWHQIAQNGIKFLEHKVISLLPDGTNSFTVDSDEAGNYTAHITPGIFGVQIPEMTSYTGHNIEYGDLTAGTAPRPGPWPYPEVWPHTQYEGGHHAGGLRFDSDHEYQLDLFMHGHYINVAGRVITQNEPFGSLILRMEPTGAGVISTPYSYLDDVEAEVVATGPRTYRAPVTKGNEYLLRGMLPGTYSIRLDNPNYTTAPVTVTIAPWQAPGILPQVSPFSPTYFFPGITHADFLFTINADWTAKGEINIARYTWSGGEDPRYQGGSESPPQFFRMNGLEERLFSWSFGEGLPSPSYTIWMRHGNGWFSRSGSGPANFDSFDGGPSDNTPPNDVPSGATSYTLDLHAYSRANPKMEIPNVTVLFGSGPSRLAGGEVAHEGTPNPTGANESGQQWFYNSSRVEVIDYARRLVRVDVLMDRAMVVTGLVQHAGTSLSGAAVILRNRYGNPLRQTVTGANGVFSFSVSPQPVFVDVNRRGFIPERTRLDPTSIDNPDTGAVFALEQVPAPTIDEFTMNRFGLFLPGVSKVNDSGGFNPEAAREKLTMTWKAKTQGKSFTYSLNGFFGENELPKPDETFTVRDKVTEVWVVDRRAFTNAFVNDLNQKVFEMVRPPNPLNFVTAQDWLRTVLTARKEGKPYYVIHRIEGWKRSMPENQFEGKINVSELPSGAFVPMLVAFTDSGGVVVRDYEVPTDKSSLQGLNLPAWVATLLEVIGLASNLPKFESSVTHHFEQGFMKVGTLKPSAEARIGLSPFTNSPAGDNYLTYKYAIGVELALGEGNGQTGPLASGPKFLGLQIQGASAEFEVSGEDKKLTLAVVLPAGDPPDLEELDKNYAPVIAPPSSPIQVTQNDFSASGKFGIVQVINTNWLGENTLAKYGFVLEIQGIYDFGIRANATLLTRPFPALSAVLQAIDRLGLSLYGVFEFTGGAKYAIEGLTEYPPLPIGSVVRGALPPKTGILGKSELTREAKLILRIAVGAQVETKNKLFNGTILVQLGAPSGTPDQDGIFFTLNLKEQGPWFTKIEGAFSIIAKVGMKLWTVDVKKQWKLVDVPFLKEFAVPEGAALSALAAGGPEAQFYLIPMEITYTVVNAASALPEAFKPSGPVLVDNFYGAGSMDLVEGANPLFVYTGIDPSTGTMTLMVSSRNGSQWSTPVKLAAAAGIISVANLALADGRIIVTWSEVSEGDISNPYPSSSIRYSVSDANRSTWSPPTLVTTGPEAMFDLELVGSGAGAMLFYLSTTEGPISQNRSLNSVQWNGASWGPSVRLNPTGLVANYEATGKGAASILAVIQTPSEQLQSIFWNGSAWSAPASISTNAGSAFSVRFSNAEEAVLAWRNAEGSIAFSKYDAVLAEWSHLTAPIEGASTEHCEILPFVGAGGVRHLVTWTTGREVTELWAAFLDDRGVLLSAPRKLSSGSEGVFSDLHVSALPNYSALVLAQYATETNRSVREFTVLLPQPNDCDGDGVSDAAEIAGGTARDCNNNGMPDACEIATGEARDDNGNGVPDDCEPAPDDCNRNGLSDRSEIEFGVGDLNLNGVLDDCERAIQTKSVALSTTISGTFYRAPNLRIKSRTATVIELEFEGSLERSDRLEGPWSVVP